jgi:choline dehydrogenase
MTSFSRRQNAAFPNGTKKYHPDIRTHAFVTKIRFSKATLVSNPRAIGVDFLDGESPYSDDARSGSTKGAPDAANTTKEVIISAGAFNAPRILKVSDVSPKVDLKKFNILVVVDLPRVGASISDHYEISAVVKFDTDFSLLEQCTWLSTPDDPVCWIHQQLN